MSAVEEESGRLDASQTRTWSEVRRGYTRFQENDVLLAKITPCMENGKFAIARKLHGGVGAGSTEFHVLRANPVRLIPEWLLHFMLQQSIRQAARAVMAGAVGQQRVPSHYLNELVVPVAPLAEQRSIVSTIETNFSQLDAAIGSLERAKANVKRARTSVLKAAVEGRLVPTEAALARARSRDYEPASTLLIRVHSERRARWSESGGKGRYDEFVPPKVNSRFLPDGWTWATVEQLASDEPRSIQSGPFGSSLLHSEFQAEGKLVIGIDNVQDGYFSPGSQNRISEAKYEQLAKYAARPRDLAITVMATIGRCCVIPLNVEPAIITKHIYRVTVDDRLCVPEYIMAVIRSPWGRENLLMESKGQTRPGLNGTIIKAFVVPVPPIAEQRRIVAEVDRRLSVLGALDATLDATLARCTKLRQSILKRAFEGKLVQPGAPGRAAPQLPLFTEEAAL